MNVRGVGIVAISISLLVSAYATNPFLDAKDDKPVSANFRGTEWNDQFPEQGIPHEIPLTAQIITTRIAKMPWGAIFKIEFTDLKSCAPEKSEIPDRRYFIVTDDRIVLLNACPNHTGVVTLREIEEDNDCAVRKISAMEKPPEFEPNDIYGITTGSFEHQEVLWKTTINLKGDLCIYDANHPSGHFTKIVWRKGVGLIEYAMGYGAGREGFRLKRGTPKRLRAL
jgi:hypothetical protein